MNKYMATVLALFLVNGAASAEAGDFTPYVGIGGGVFSTKYAEQNTLGSLELSDSTWGSFIKAGVDYKQYGGIELRTGLTGSIAQNFPVGTIGSAVPLNLTIQVSNFFSYFGKLQYPINPSFRVYGLIGGTAGRFLAESGNGLRGSAVSWKTSVSYGAGVEYKFRSQGSISIEWVQYWNDVALAIVPGAMSKGSLSGASLMINKSF